MFVSDAWVYRAADRLIGQHGPKALPEVNRLICDAINHDDRDRAVLMLRIRLAILVLEDPRKRRMLAQRKATDIAA